MADPVTLDLEYNVNKTRTRPAQTNPDQVHLADLAKAESNRIQNTASAAADAIKRVPFTRFNDRLDASQVSAVPDVANKVTQAVHGNSLKSVNSNAIAITPDNLQEKLAQIDIEREILADESIPLPDHVHAELAAMSGSEATPAQNRGFFIQINDLVADIMRLISKLNDRDRQKTDHLKKDYGKLNKEIGEAIYNKGNTTLWSQLGGLFISMSAIGVGTYIGSPTFTTAGMELGRQIPAIAGGIITTQYETTQTVASNRLGLLSTDMQNTASKSGDNSGWKNELIQSLNDIKQMLTAAARAN